MVEKRATFACTPGLHRPGNRVLRPVGRRRPHGRPPTQPRWKALSAAACTQRSKSQACATENDPLGGLILARSQAVQPTRATLIRIKIVDLDTERAPLRKGSDALSVTICYRTIKSVLMRFSPTRSLVTRTVSAVSLPAASAALWAKPAGLATKAPDTNEPFSPHPFTVGMHPMKKSSGCTGGDGRIGRGTRCLWRLLVAFARATARANDLCGDRPNCVPRTLRAPLRPKWKH